MSEKGVDELSGTE
jgi:predicted transcriptional regulator